MKKKLLTLLTLLLCVCSGAWAQDIVWDFTNLTAQSFENGKSYSFKATDGKTEMRYSAGSGDAIIAKDGTTNGYLKENGKTGGATVKDIDGTTNVGKTRLIRLFVTGKGKLTITCNSTAGTYKVLDGSASGTTLVSSLSAGTQSAEIEVNSLLWIETSTKGYIEKITWSPSSTAPKHSVTYSLGEGTGTPPTPADVAEGDDFTVASAPSDLVPPTGKEFKCWNDGTNDYNAGATYTMGTANVTLTAVYQNELPKINKIIYSLADNVGSAEVTASDATVNAGVSLVLSNTNGRIMLTPVAGETFQDGDAITFSGTIGNTSKAYGIKYGPGPNLGTNLYVGAGEPCSVSGTLSLSSASSDLYIGRYDGSTTTLTSLVISRMVSVKSQTFAGVKIGGTLATEDTDYTIDGTTITLVGSFITAPTVALVNHVVYGNDTNGDIDVNVTFGDASEGFFTGTATIDGTTYTVKAPASTTATLEADETALTVTSVKIATGTAEFTLTGANLTGETVTLAFASAVDGLTVSPASIEIAEGAVNQEVTVSYKSAAAVAEATVNLTVSTTGVDNIVIPVTYSSTAGVTTIEDVTDGTTWDWSATGLSADALSPDANDLVPFANIEGWGGSFNAAALTGKGQYLYYKSQSCFQGSILKFHTTIPGKVKVIYSNTGNRTAEGDRRFLYINSTKVDDGSMSAGNTKNTVENIAVAAGDVTLEGFQGTGTDTPNMLRIYKVIFYANAPMDVTVSDAKYATFSDVFARDFSESGITVYTAKANGTTVSLTAVADGIVPANTGVVLFADAATTKSIPVATTTLTTLANNEMMPNVTAATVAWDAGEGKYNYILSNETEGVGFYKATTAGATLKANRAYLSTTTTASAAPFLGFEGGEATGIRPIDNGQLIMDNVIYDLNGRRVENPTKGVYIMNGKKVVIK